MILKLRVPNFIENHLIMDFLTDDGTKLWADITELRRSFGYGQIPVYGQALVEKTSVILDQWEAGELIYAESDFWKSR